MSTAPFEAIPEKKPGQVRCGDCSFRVDADSPKDDVRQAMLARGATGCLKRAAYEYKSPTRWHSCDMFREQLRIDEPSR